MTKRRKTTGLTPAETKAGSRPKGGYEVTGTLRPPERVPRILGGGKGRPLSKAGAAIRHPEHNVELPK